MNQVEKAKQLSKYTTSRILSSKFVVTYLATIFRSYAKIKKTLLSV